MRARPATPLSKDQQALEFIRSAIMAGRYTPQSRITASQVAQEAGMSVGPIREAMRKLEAEGLVSYQANIGATVIGMDYRMLSETLSTLAILEGAATAAAAPLLSDEEIDELQAINDAMAAADKGGDLAQVSRHNRKFHLACYSRCPNSWMLDLITKTANRSFVGRRSLFFEVPHRPEHSVHEHQEIVRLVRARASSELIEAAVRRHKQPTIDLVESRARYVFETTDVIQ